MRRISNVALTFTLCAGALAAQTGTHARATVAKLKPGELAVSAIARADDKAWMDEVEVQRKVAKQGKGDILFIGDSITAGFPNAYVKRETNGKSELVYFFSYYWGRFQVADFGIGGDMTQNVIWRLEQGTLDGLNPKLVVLLIGTNNGSDGVPYAIQDVADGVAAIIRILRAKLPASKILLMGVFPRGTWPEGWKRIKDLNVILSKMDDGKTIQFMDIGNKLTPDGVPTTDIQPDLLHLNGRGYDIWAQAIQPVILKAMGRPASEALPPLYVPAPAVAKP